MRDLSEERLADAVVERLASISDDRSRRVLSALVRHLHAFAREVELTEAEWMLGLRFLTATGQISSDTRQEFILLSDVLGLSALVDAMNHRVPEGATLSTVLGPFFVQGAPELGNGADLTAGVDTSTAPGEPTWVNGRVLTLDGQPIAGAAVDVWQTRPDALYDVQDDDTAMQMRARFHTDSEGRFYFKTYKPVSYPVPRDGPVGGLLNLIGGHGMRPAHIHAIASAPGYRQVVTHIFPAGDEYLDSDTVFAVKDSLVAEFRPNTSLDAATRLGMPSPFLEVDFDFRLVPETRDVH